MVLISGKIMMLCNKVNMLCSGNKKLKCKLKNMMKEILDIEIMFRKKQKKSNKFKRNKKVGIRKRRKNYKLKLQKR